jgi:hypothetical protein
VTHVTPRQAFALANPLNRAGGDVAPYRAARVHAAGLLIMTIMAVDR